MLRMYRNEYVDYSHSVLFSISCVIYQCALVYLDTRARFCALSVVCLCVYVCTCGTHVLVALLREAHRPADDTQNAL